MAQAFGEICGHPEALANIRLGGMTDRLILRAGFDAIGRPFEEATYQEVMACYLGHLEREVRQSDGYAIYDGVEQAVAACESLARAAVGLGTGNVEAGARTKLERGDLNPHFPFGGFGSDAEERSMLVEAGAVRGAKRLGIPRDEVRVVVIGDTPKDVEAAHAIGARCVTVATGAFSESELQAAGADAVFPALDASGATDAILDA